MLARYGFVPPQATSLMLHIEGHGPRRVYQFPKSGRCFVVVKRRRRMLTEKEAKQIQAFLSV